MKNPNDQRVVKTRESLVNAYLDLVMENASNKVLEICNKAVISPITFYHHFGDKEELIKYVIKYQLRHILPIPEKLKPSGNKQLLIYLIRTLSVFFINNKKVIFNSLQTITTKGYKNSYLNMLTVIIEYWVDKEFTALNNLFDPEIKWFLIKWFVGGLLFALISCNKENKIIDIDKITNALKILSLILNIKN